MSGRGYCSWGCRFDALSVPMQVGCVFSLNRCVPDLKGIAQVLEGYDTQLNEDEVLCLVQHWDKAQDGTINYGEFVDALRMADQALD